MRLRAGETDSARISGGIRPEQEKERRIYSILYIYADT